MTAPDPELQAAAEEELAAAATLSWAALAKLAPWGDTYEGFGPAGGALEFERSYIWRDQAGGDILCEVVAYRGPSRYDKGVRASRVIAKP
ncbi:MAG TPA: hypothetical protein VHX64_13165 [Caulobacteraceae bacterium]|jgi:hypothetical protein|nr:hypothetical protein [Caulobacteraceae bacterium]